jgi:glutamate-1-semialdehyde 2,1-aminomutase
MVAGLVTLQQLEDGSIYSQLEQRTAEFVSAIQARVNHPDFQIVHQGSIFWLLFQREAPRSAHAIDKTSIVRFSRLHRKILDAGFYLPPSGYEVGFVSAAHKPAELAQAAEGIGEIIAAEMHGG